jgi:hypothetical protein
LGKEISVDPIVEGDDEKKKQETLINIDEGKSVITD